ncbi:hypothetical protein BGZ79_003959 [Entomortierella chlamydospora]|nr:hypothetical protein BGZ79_003959 [Entomortierella chlamydospora]
MNRGIGLVAYGDSDEESSGEDTPMTAAPPSKTKELKESGMAINSHFLWILLHETLQSLTRIARLIAITDSERPTLQDTIAARSIANTRPSGNESLNKIASTNLMKQGLAVSSENIHTDPSTDTTANDGSSSSNRHSFIRSQSGTPLPPDHSAAADVFNTPTGGRSPQVPSTERVPIADESRAVESGDDKDGDDGEIGSRRWHNNRVNLMKSLLRPKPIPGVENFGIPPNPEGEVNPDVQAKMEQFHHVKVTRGIHFNQSLMKNKNFRNPHIYASLVELVALDETGSNFEKSEFFDFKGYGPESYASGIAEAQKQASEKLAQQQAAARSQLQFVPGSTVGSGVGFPSAAPVVKPQQLPASRLQQSLSNSSVTTASASTQRNRKSKWDQSSDDPSGKKSRHFV